MVHDNSCPVYLSKSVQPVTSNPVRQHLRSVSSLDFIVPQTRTKFGDRAFSVAGLTVWNSLPESVRSAETLASFKRKLFSMFINYWLNTEKENMVLTFLALMNLSALHTRQPTVQQKAMAYNTSISDITIISNAYNVTHSFINSHVVKR